MFEGLRDGDYCWEVDGCHCLEVVCIDRGKVSDIVSERGRKVTIMSTWLFIL